MWHKCHSEFVWESLHGTRCLYTDKAILKWRFTAKNCQKFVRIWQLLLGHVDFEPKNVFHSLVKKTHLSEWACKLPWFMERSTRPRMEICVNSGLPIAMVSCLHQSNVYIKRKLMVLSPCGAYVHVLLLFTWYIFCWFILTIHHLPCSVSSQVCLHNFQPSVSPPALIQ